MPGLGSYVKIETFCRLNRCEDLFLSTTFKVKLFEKRLQSLNRQRPLPVSPKVREIILIIVILKSVLLINLCWTIGPPWHLFVEAFNCGLRIFAIGGSK